MPKHLLHSTVALLAIAATGCATFPGVPSGMVAPAPGQELASQPLSLSSLPKAGVSGVVMAPAHVIAAGGGNVVAAGGGNVIAAGSGNVVAAGGGNFASDRRVLALGQQVAVAGAEVYLTDMAGERLGGIAPALTDAAGRYALRGTPDETAYMVVARFKAPDGAGIMLTRLGHASRNDHDQVVSVATTLVSEAFVQHGTPAEGLDPATFDAAVEAVADRLTEATMPDLTRPEDVAAKAAAIATVTPAVRQAIGAPALPSPSQAPAPLVDELTSAVPPAPPGVHKAKSPSKGKSRDKRHRPSGPATPSTGSSDRPAPPAKPPATESGADADKKQAPPHAEPSSGEGAHHQPAEQDKPKPEQPTGKNEHSGDGQPS